MHVIVNNFRLCCVFAGTVEKVETLFFKKNPRVSASEKTEQKVRAPRCTNRPSIAIFFWRFSRLYLRTILHNLSYKGLERKNSEKQST